MDLSITIPKEGELLIKIGDQVDFKTPLIKNHVKKEVKVPLAKNLHIHPKKIFTVLKKFVGEKIKKGDIIAQHKAFLKNLKYISEYDGVLKEVNHSDGHITLEIDSEQKATLTSYFKGEVVEIDEKTHQEKVIIKYKVKNAKQYNLKEAKDFFGGPIFYTHVNSLQIATEDDVNGKIICVNEIQSYEQTKVETLGAAGFIGLHTLPEPSHVPLAKIKDIPDWEEFLSIKLPYCTIDKEQSRMYVYE